MDSLLSNLVVAMNLQFAMWILYVMSLIHSNMNDTAFEFEDGVIRELIQNNLESFDIVSICSSLRKKYKRGLPDADNDDGDDISNRKRQMVKYDRERAYRCVMDDWMGDVPRFDDKQFERTFRIKRWMVDFCISNLAHHDRFWLQTIDAANRLSISPYVKFLAAQKLLCYGVSFSAFKDYFQIGESTARKCMSKLARGIVECSNIADIYLRTPSRHDAKRIVELHKIQHGIDGMLGSLDVTKIHWANCPNAWKGQFEGKEGYPTIALEAVSDYNLWIWHDSFGLPGGLNDINIWERSPLLESMLNGTHSEIDHPFEINNETFHQLFYLVDGIYPWLSRFLSTISVPTTIIDSIFSKWQESKRKDIERAFGVLKMKFLCLKHPVKMHHRDDIFYVVRACIAMHNMMVKVRVDEEGIAEDYSLYDTPVSENIQDMNEQEEHGNIGTDTFSQSGTNHSRSIDRMDDYRFAQKKWKELYDVGEAVRLQDAVKKQLYRMRHGDDEYFRGEEIDPNFDPLEL